MAKDEETPNTVPKPIRQRNMTAAVPERAVKYTLNDDTQKWQHKPTFVRSTPHLPHMQMLVCTRDGLITPAG